MDEATVFRLAGPFLGLTGFAVMVWEWHQSIKYDLKRSEIFQCIEKRATKIRNKYLESIGKSGALPILASPPSPWSAVMASSAVLLLALAIKKVEKDPNKARIEREIAKLEQDIANIRTEELGEIRQNRLWPYRVGAALIALSFLFQIIEAWAKEPLSDEVKCLVECSTDCKGVTNSSEDLRENLRQRYRQIWPSTT